jgi:hypothetical protein
MREIGARWQTWPRRVDRPHTYLLSHFNDPVAGILGNDDSGAMGSFVTFTMMGLPQCGTEHTSDHTTVRPLSQLSKWMDGPDSNVAQRQLRGQG